MLAVIMVLAAAGFGAAVVRALGFETTRLERLALSSAVALTAAPWLWLGGAAAFGFTAGLPLATAAMAIAGIALHRRRRTPAPAAAVLPATSALSWLALALLLAQLVHGHMLHDEPGGLYTGGFSYADLPLHSTLAHHYAVTPSMTMESPLVAGTPLTYPLLGDFLVGCLMRGGWSAPVAFTITGWLSIMTMVALIQAVALRMFGRSSAATLATWFVILNGSAAALWYVLQDLHTHGLSRPIEQLPDYAHLHRHGFHASNLTKDFFLPQRSLVAALPACWAVIWMIQAAVRLDDGRGAARRPLAVAAVLTGTLPFLHAHTFFVAAGLLGWFAMWRSAAARRPAWPWFAAAAAAIVLAAPQLAWQFGQTWRSGFGKLNLGWMTPDDGSVWWFWLRNWGVAFVLVPINLVVAVRLTRRDFALPLYTALLVVFVAANVYQFQPNVWDNMKFLIHAYMIVALLAAGGVAHWLAQRGARRVVAAVTIAGMTVIGALSVLRATEARDQLASRPAVVMAAKLRDLLPADARVLTADAHNHVVPMLTGRRIVMGYRGWLWTHGVDYRALERDVRKMFKGGVEAKPLLRHHRVTHVYIGPQERAEWGAKLEDFRMRYPSVYAVDGIEVFDVRKLSTARASARVSVK